MLKPFCALVVAVALCWPALAIEERHGVMTGVILKLDAAAKTVVIKTADGTTHTLHFLERTAVHGGQSAAVVSKDTFRGLKEGTEVAIHYSAKGTEETAHEIDVVGKDGLKATEATVVDIDRGGKKLAVKTADGTSETFRLTGRAVEDAGKDMGKGAEKSAKVTVYYTEEAGEKVAHVIRRAI